MEEIFLDAQARKEIGRSGVSALRKLGFIPAVVYGQDKEAQAIKVSHKQLFQLLHQHRLENVVINLKIKDDKKNKPRPCLIKEIQYEPVRGDIRHVDFNEISLTKTIKINVPVVAQGEPIGVKQEGGTLEHILWEVEVECLPTDIPKEFSVDVSGMKIGDAIHIKDIKFADNIKVLNSPDATVLSLSAPVKEEVSVEAAPVEGEAQEPEVIKEKKEVPAEGAEEEAKPKEKEKEKK